MGIHPSGCAFASLNQRRNEMPNQVLEMSTYKVSEVSRRELHGQVLPPATETHQPIHHYDLLDMLEEHLPTVGLRFGKQHHGLSHDGARYFGVIELINGQERDGYNIMMGVRNAHDKRFAAQVAFGNQVMVCANLCFWGTYMLGRKHTTHILRDLPKIIEGTFERIPEMNQVQDKRFEHYKDVTLSQRNADHLVMNMLRAGAVNTSRIEKVIREWDEPSFDHGDRTVWRMFNAATQALKGVNIHEMPQRTIELTKVCDHAAGFKAAA